MVTHRRFILALAAALLMLLLLGSVAFADGPTTSSVVPPQQDQIKPVCVEGYVINHREKPIDGSKMLPKDPATGQPVYLVVTASTVDETGALTTVATSKVDKDGHFKFTGLPKDTPIVFTLDLPDGWAGIVPDAVVGGVAQTNPTKFKWDDDKEYKHKHEDFCYRIVFKIKRLVTIKVLKWEERLDGTVQPGEDWVVTATPVNDPFAQTIEVTTASSADMTAASPLGQTMLTLTPGTWSIAETVKPDWTPLTPPVVERVIDQYDPVVNEVVFKNREPVCHPKIIVTKVGYGTNSDWKEEYLGVLAGWKVTVVRADKGSAPITKITAGDGRAVFDGLFPGVYKVFETEQKGWEVIGDNPVTVSLKDCETVNVTIQNKEKIGKLRITGHKFFKAWEKPLKWKTVGLDGWTITAKLLGVGTTISTMTNALGEYEFTEADLKKAGMAFPGASIKVCEEVRDHWVNVTPECVTITFPYPVPPSYDGAVVNFTNVQDPPSEAAVTASTAPIAMASSGCSAYHTVSAGDTVAKLANKYGTSASSIVRANGIRNADVIYLGQSLCIR